MNWPVFVFGVALLVMSAAFAEQSYRMFRQRSWLGYDLPFASGFTGAAVFCGGVAAIAYAVA